MSRRNNNKPNLSVINPAAAEFLKPAYVEEEAPAVEETTPKRPRKPRNTTKTTETKTDKKSNVLKIKKTKYTDVRTARTYYIDNNILAEFDALCDTHELDKSKVINEALREWMDSFDPNE